MSFIWGAHHVARYLYYTFEMSIATLNKSPENSVPLSYLVRTIYLSILSIYPLSHFLEPLIIFLPGKDSLSAVFFAMLVSTKAASLCIRV